MVPPIPRQTGESVSWTDDAVCIGISTDLFFVDRGEGSSSEMQMIFKMCSGCPVRNECLEEALRVESHYGTRHGIWGGKTPTQRNLIARERLMDKTGMCHRNLHEMSEENTGRIPGKEWRFCRACQKQRPDRRKSELTAAPMPSRTMVRS